MNSSLTNKLLLSHLKKHVPEPLRMDALRLLYHLSSKRQITYEDVGSIIKKDTTEGLLSALISAGIIEEGFTSIRLIDDDVFIDFIKSLYKMELSGEPHDNEVKIEKCIKQKTENGKRVLAGEGFLDMSIPSTSYSAPIVIKMLEEVSKVSGIPTDVTGRLQIAIAEAMNILPAYAGCSVGFKIEDNNFLIKIDIPSEGFVIENDISLGLIRGIVDDVRIERLPGLTRLIMSKKVYKPSQPALR